MIDGHSHLLMSSSGRKKRAVADLTEVDLGVLFAGLDRLGIERVVSLVQDTTRVWGGWPTLADDEIAGILDTTVRRLMRIEPMQELETGGGRG